jgi:hypothetical protein
VKRPARKAGITRQGENSKAKCWPEGFEDKRHAWKDQGFSYLSDYRMFRCGECRKLAFRPLAKEVAGG